MRESCAALVVMFRGVALGLRDGARWFILAVRLAGLAG